MHIIFINIVGPTGNVVAVPSELQGRAHRRYESLRNRSRCCPLAISRAKASAMVSGDYYYYALRVRYS